MIKFFNIKFLVRVSRYFNKPQNSYIIIKKIQSKMDFVVQKILIYIILI